jgi:hypothetical protein
MSVLTEHLPAAVLILAHDGNPGFASAMYKQFISGTAPPWFQAMPTAARSFVVLDYLPNWLSEPMTLDIQQMLASPAARPTATSEPTSITGLISISTSITSGTEQTSSKEM